MEINCENIVERYLLTQNPLYSFSFPISILVAIIVFGCGKVYKWSDNSYINQILIPILALLGTMVIIDLISRIMVSKDEKMKLMMLCKQWMHDPKQKSNKLDMDVVANYQVQNINNINTKSIENKLNLKRNIEIKKEKESFTNKIVEHEQQNVVDAPIAEIPHISPQTIPHAPDGKMCIQNSGNCNLCSGQPNDNPYKLVAPIPGPQWMPESAATVQNRLVNNNYTASVCPIK